VIYSCEAWGVREREREREKEREREREKERERDVFGSCVLVLHPDAFHRTAI